MLQVEAGPASAGDGVFTHILGWTQEAEVRNLALSLGERVASVASQVRGYLVMSAHLIPPRRASDPSPGPRRLVKAPVAVHPLPLGEGQAPIPSPFRRERGRRQRWDSAKQVMGVKDSPWPTEFRTEHPLLMLRNSFLECMLVTALAPQGRVKVAGRQSRFGT
jgi:hypothetical protein